MIDMNDPEVIESLKYLLVPKARKIELAAMPYSSTKNFFVPCKEEGYECAEITSESGDDITLMTRRGKQVEFKRDKLLQMNPPKYEMCDDMADLTFLNDATVYHNLRERYVNWYIYTYSGLFCVTINPFKRLPLYTMKMVHYYRGKKKNEVPPHLYLVADNAYAAMCRDRKNQSMLITGESGAGKTENTKKVIQYFAFVAAGIGKKKGEVEDPNKPSLEDQIVSANPVLEAYGNAKTTRNNNSSRFGKFIRIHFTNIFGIAGADIESYLLEKSRITYCMECERNYHIFYQLCSGALPELNKEIELEADPGKYFFVNQGMLTIDRVDDKQEMLDTKKAFDVLQFTQEQQIDLFKITSAVANWGNQQWKQRPREEQAEPDGTEWLEKVARLLGLDEAELIKGLTKPRIKVGTEFVNKGQNLDQCKNSVQALSKAAFSRAFTWLVVIANETLDVKELKRAHFIGVLDIAGFETFEYNGFEQIAINFTNERLQQFFNNFMFVLEQEEYKKEGIVWETQSFGADLQATIDLIGAKMGIFLMLEEECVVPKGSDATYREKLYKQHLGKHPSFAKPKPKKGARFEAHFDLTHYAGVVSYSVDGWLEKNKDPINMTVAAMFKANKKNKLLSLLFNDIGEEQGGGGGKKGGKPAMTISAAHREQLDKLMKTLDATSPHFVRCIIPNELKTGGVLDAHLVMHQLNCNGVLEGIRICRKGYPSRLLYAEFLARYGILAASRVKATKEPKAACFEVLDEIKMDTENYRIGLSKVLFKAGILGVMEEHRDAVIERLLRLLQAQMRRYLVKKNIKVMLEQKKAVTLLQKNVKAALSLRNWKWMNLWSNIQPLLQGAKKEEERLAREAEEARLAELAKLEAEKAAAEAAQRAAEAAAQAEAERKEKERLAALEMQRIKEEQENAAKAIQSLKGEKENLENHIADLDEQLLQSESKAADLNRQKKGLEGDIEDLKKAMENVQNNLSKTDAEAKSKDNQIHKMQDEMAQQDDNINRLSKEKKRLDDLVAATTDQLRQEEDKCSHLNRVKSTLEQSLDEAEENCEREKRAKNDMDKARRKVEADLKSAQSAIEELSRLKQEQADALTRKEAECKSLNAKVEDVSSQLSSAGRRNKELVQQVNETQEEVDSERAAKVKAEKQRAELKRELDELCDKLEEAGGATAAQAEINRKREAELAQLRSQLDQTNMQNEAALAALKKKQSDAIAEVSAQVDALNKLKNKLEKEKQAYKAEVDDAKASVESATKAKESVEKSAKLLEQQLNESANKCDEAQRQLSDMNSQKNRLSNEKNALQAQVEQLEASSLALNKAKQQMACQVEEARRQSDEEARAKSSLAQQLRNMNVELEEVKAQLEDEHSQRCEIQKGLSKANADAQQWKSRFEADSLAKEDELEEQRRKFSAKLAESQEQVEASTAKCLSLEKTKAHLQADIEDLMAEVEKANLNASAMEKKQKQFDRFVSEWKQKCESITLELEASQKESRMSAAEIFKLKQQYQESQESLESLSRENKNLAEEIKDLMDQLSEGAKNMHETEKAKKRSEVEKDELQLTLEEAERALENQEAKIVFTQLELSNARQEIESRLHEKDEEFENNRRSHQRALESLQASLDAEIKSKAELSKQKKKLEADVRDVEIALENANKNVVEAQKLNAKLRQMGSEHQSQLEDQERQKVELREAVVAADRRCNNLMVELDEFRSALEHNDRARKAAEQDLQDAVDRMNEMNSHNSTLVSHKRKLENDVAALRSELDDALSEVKNAQDSLNKSYAETARQSDELKFEQDHSLNAERLRKNLELQVKDLQTRLDQAESSALKGGKKFTQKLEARIAELESELENEQRHHQEALKESKRSDRKLKELVSQSEDDRHNQIRLQETVEKLNNKVRFYKRQAEETEEVAANNLNKFRAMSAAPARR